MMKKVRETHNDGNKNDEEGTRNSQSSLCKILKFGTYLLKMEKGCAKFDEYIEGNGVIQSF